MRPDLIENFCPVDMKKQLSTRSRDAGIYLCWRQHDDSDQDDVDVGAQ